ncbi:MAG: DUF6036 family nucleotidyltransferase [Elusimicrobia bacterium]|nr:DUF6036 family nucleotidyltransferase [Elusimicrobiota bacterium]
MKQAGEEELLAFLKDVDLRFDGEDLKSRIPLYVLGGAAAVIAYGSRRGTEDIDAWLEDERIARKLEDLAGKGTELAQKHQVYFQPANTTLMLIEEPEWRDRSIEFFKGKLKHFKIMAAGKEDLILSKLSRYNDRDREDIRFLAEERKVDVKNLIACYKAARDYYVGHLPTLDTTFNVVLEEHFAHKPLKLE